MATTVGRGENDIIKGYPQPVDSRFESLKCNIELISKFRNTKASTSFKGMSLRKELWGAPQAQPDFLDRTKITKEYWQPKSTLPFKSDIGHQPVNIKKPFNVPDGYSYETLKRGYEATTTLRNPKSLVDMSKSPQRDNQMYQNLDKDYIKTIKKEARMRKYALENYLPNSLRRENSMESIQQQSLNSITSGFSKKLAKSNKKGQPSETMNRLASLTNLETSASNKNVSMTFLSKKGLINTTLDPLGK